MGDDPLKSAYELAMEKLRARDGEAQEIASLTDRQRERIAEIRQEFKAKQAEIELGYREEINKARRAGDGARAAELEQEYQTERQRLADREEERVSQVREEG
jgi:Spy/CpxP family protein refolding chaperone